MKKKIQSIANIKVQSLQDILSDFPQELPVQYVMKGLVGKFETVDDKAEASPVLATVDTTFNLNVDHN